MQATKKTHVRYLILFMLFLVTTINYADRATIAIENAREQASELMGYVRELTIIGLMDEKPMMIWAAHYLSAMVKALMDDAELGMMH